MGVVGAVDLGGEVGMETPEELAEEYVEAEFKGNGGNVSRAVCKYDFMSGYKAAIDLIHSNTTKDMSDLANAFAANYFGKEYAVSFDSFLAGYQAALDANSPKKLDSWISVKERLPEQDVPVLVYGKVLNDIRRVLGVRRRYRGDQDWKYSWESEDEYIYTQDEVSHWMPLPKLSEGE